MTGSSSKLLQIQGKWYRERTPKNIPKPEAKNLHPFFNYGQSIHKESIIIRKFLFLNISITILFAPRQVAVRLHKATGGRSFFWGFKLRNITSRLTTAIIHVWSYMRAYIYIYRTITYYNYIYILYTCMRTHTETHPPTHRIYIYIYIYTRILECTSPVWSRVWMCKSFSWDLLYRTLAGLQLTEREIARNTGKCLQWWSNNMNHGQIVGIDTRR